MSEKTEANSPPTKSGSTDAAKGGAEKTAADSPSGKSSSRDTTKAGSTEKIEVSSVSGSASASSESAANSDVGSAESSAIYQDLHDQHRRYVSDLEHVCQKASKKYLEVVTRLTNNLHKIRQDALNSDPSMAFALQVSRAYRTHDFKGLSDAHRTLVAHLDNTSSNAAKRVGDALQVARDEYLALCEETQSTLRARADDYSKGILDCTKNTSVDSLDRQSAILLAHSLLLGATVMPDKGSQQAA